VAEPVTVWTTVSGSAQIVTDGVVTIPIYRDALHPDGRLTPGGPGQYSNERSWYDAVNARTAIGISQNGRTLTLMVVDARGGSQGMTVREVADLLVRDYAVWNALNLDGGGSASMVLVDPATKMPRMVNSSADGPDGRAVGSSLLVFAGLAGSPTR
jgi:exopolysaccharide biosynthesis protein